MNETKLAKDILLERKCEECKWSIWYSGILGRPGLCSLHEEKPLVNDYEICDQWESKT